MDRRNKRIFDKDFKIQTAKQRIGKNVIMNIVMMSFSILYASKIEYLYTNIILKHIKTGKSFRSDGNNFYQTIIIFLPAKATQIYIAPKELRLSVWVVFLLILIPHGEFFSSFCRDYLLYSPQLRIFNIFCNSGRGDI